MRLWVVKSEALQVVSLIWASLSFLATAVRRNDAAGWVEMLHRNGSDGFDSD